MIGTPARNGRRLLRNRIVHTVRLERGMQGEHGRVRVSKLDVSYCFALDTINAGNPFNRITEARVSTRHGSLFHPDG